METCEVSFDETLSSSSTFFEPIGPYQIGETIFVGEEHDDVDLGDPEPCPPAAPVEHASTTLDNGPDITSSTTWCPLESDGAGLRGVQAIVEGDTTSLREALGHIQHNHPPQEMIGEISERCTRSRYQ
jgi:hypothetical protein